MSADLRKSSLMVERALWAHVGGKVGKLSVGESSNRFSLQVDPVMPLFADRCGVTPLSDVAIGKQNGGTPLRLLRSYRTCAVS